MQPSQKLVPPPPDQCFRAKDIGTCGEFPSVGVTSFYYDIKSRSCRVFRYYGCGGNNNKFYTYTACQRTCKRPVQNYCEASL